MTSPVLLEVCVGDPESFAAAIRGGADRIELCSAMELGGLTPTPGLVALAARSPVPVYALVRPRGGDFVFSPAEREAMLADIEAIRAAGLAGVVIGASRLDGSLDAETLEALATAAVGLGTTLHRAFDLVPEIEPAVDLAVELGFERVLTSGRAARALDGVADLRRANARAAGRIVIMAGSGVGPDTVSALLAQVPLAEVHGSCARPAVPLDPRLQALGFTQGPRRTDANEVRRMKHLLHTGA